MCHCQRLASGTTVCSEIEFERERLRERLLEVHGRSFSRKARKVVQVVESYSKVRSPKNKREEALAAACSQIKCRLQPRRFCCPPRARLLIEEVSHHWPFIFKKKVDLLTSRRIFHKRARYGYRLRDGGFATMPQLLHSHLLLALEKRTTARIASGRLAL